MTFIINRLKAPSTFAGIAAVLASFGLFGLTETQWNELFGAFASIAGVIAVILGERKGEN